MSAPLTIRSPAVRTGLFNLSPARKSQHKQKRVGRGQGSGRGGTAGRGANGQKSRSGYSRKPGFEGGQTTLIKRTPKRGFVNQSARTWAPVNLDRIQHWVQQGRLTSSPTQPITARELLLSGCIHDVHDGIKLLASGKQFFQTPIHIISSRASKSAIKAVENTGGSVFCRYYNPLALQDCVKGRTDRVDAAPTRREDIKWYTKWQNRGYLAPESITKMPIVTERWRELSRQLIAFETEEFKALKK